MSSNSIQQIEDHIASLETKQLALKILMNSLYGALGNQYFRYYDIRLAEAVTITGKFVILYLEKHINRYLNNLLGTKGIQYSIAGDTDSLVFSFDRIVQKIVPEEKQNDIEFVTRFIDKFAKTKVEPFIDTCCEEIAQYLNAPENTLKMKREVIANTGIWIAKKKYVLNVIDNEGVFHKEPKIKMMGVEAIKSSTPTIFREKIKDAIKIILNQNEDDLIAFVSQMKQDLYKFDPSDIAFPRGVTDLEKYEKQGHNFQKGTPIHCRAAIVYNAELEKRNLTSKYEEIRSGDKIKFIYLKMPNPTQQNVIGFKNFLPNEFELDAYIDKDLQFEKGFRIPIEIITNVIGWNTRKVYSLLDFM